jgi:cysteine desulfurase/selenocysteine lyase|tara:strand:- start:486 stop:1703 length:1218 start_codon:yes stop_codon:yes gene_type:complete
MFDVDKIRSDFPILNRQINGQGLVYLDNAASSQKPQVVINAISKVYSEEYANVHRGIHYLSMKATENFENARSEVSNYLKSKSDQQIVFTKNATEAINLVASSFGETEINEGDEIILSVLEHHSNIVPWHFIRERKKAIIKWVDIDSKGLIDIEKLKSLISPKTKIISITHMSNVLGTVQPIKDIIDLAHESNIPVLIDGTQGAVHNPIDVMELDVDFYVLTGHKLYGPSGIGVLYAKSDYLQNMKPFQGGGEMIDEVTKENVTYASGPQKFEAGTPPIAQAIGLGEAIKYVNHIGLDEIHKHEQSITDYARNKLMDIDGLSFLLEPSHSRGIFSFTMSGSHPHDISTIIDKKGIAIRAGSHCAEPLLQTFGMTSTCRASIAMYNNKKDIDHLCESLLYCKKFFS